MSVWRMTAGGRRPDWRSERDRIDLAAVVTRLLGPAPGRRGERGRRLWWPCPFHQDRNPSFCVDPGKPFWRCFGCGTHGDAADFVMRLDGRSFPEAVAYLTGGPAAPRPGRAPRRPVAPATPPPPAESSGLSEADALALVESAAARLWTPEGSEARAYLTGRGLTFETIRAARLGFAPRVRAVTRDGRAYTASGIILPWWDGDRLALVKVRQPEGRRPKYAEVFRSGAHPPQLYPGPGSVRIGRPAVITEGEFDALLLGQALGDRAAVVTLGSASIRHDSPILVALLKASPWYVATDADPAGDRAADAWSAFAPVRRVRPPAPFKDWTEAGTDAPGTYGTAMNLARWWGDVLAGNPAPPSFTRDELATWEWGRFRQFNPNELIADLGPGARYPADIYDF